MNYENTLQVKGAKVLKQQDNSFSDNRVFTVYVQYFLYCQAYRQLGEQADFLGELLQGVVVQVQQGQVTQVGQGPAPGHDHQLVILEREGCAYARVKKQLCVYVFVGNCFGQTVTVFPFPEDPFW